MSLNIPTCLCIRMYLPYRHIHLHTCIYIYIYIPVFPVKEIAQTHPSQAHAFCASFAGRKALPAGPTGKLGAEMLEPNVAPWYGGLGIRAYRG